MPPIGLYLCSKSIERSATLRAGLRRKEACYLLFPQHLRTPLAAQIRCADWFDMLGYSQYGSLKPSMNHLD
jgi:hypothetical protein